jgi:hypothetical protein
VVDWVSDLILNPQKHHFPFLGEVHDIRNVPQGKEFEEVQLVLLGYLSSGMRKDEGLDKSLSILCHYYPEYESEIGSWISALNSNQIQTIPNKP